MSQFEMTTEQKKSIPWRLVLIFLFFSAAIILVGISFYNTQRKRIFSEYQNNLSDISSLKIRQIEEWRTERLGDAAVICQNEPLINCIKEYFADYNKPELKRELIRWMESVYKEYDYSGVLLVDTLFKVRLSIVSNDTLAGDAISKDLESVRKDHVVIMTDLHKANCINYVHLDLVIPLLNYKSNNPVLVGIAILRVDPQKALFPLVQSWPIPGKSSETLIVRKEGDSLLYLNELKYKHNSALKMKAPLSDQNLLGAKVVNGTKGFVEGIDYRNIPVVGYLTDIPGLKWFMVAKVDKDEIQAPLKRYLIISVIGIILLILINALVFGYWIWNQQVIFYRNQLKNENDIRESEEKFNTAFLQSPVSITISSLVDNNFIDVNNIFLQDSEYSRDEVIGHTANEIAIWADETERQWILNEISEKGKIFGKIIRYRSKTGRLIYGLTSMAVVKVNGESCNLSTVINITESIETEEKLRETNEYLSNLFSYANAPIIVWDKSLTVTRFNPAFEVLSGYSKEEVVGNKIGTLFSKEKTETSIDLIKSAVSGERWETVEIEIQRKDGDTRFVLWNSANILDKDGKTVVETIAQGQDITKRKKAEEELRESENKFRQTFDLSPVGIVMVGLDKRFLRCNNSFSQSLGYKPEELIGKAIADVTFHEDIELGMDDMMSILNEEIESTQIQKRYLRKDGNIVWGEVLISLVRDHKNQAQYFLAIIQDITERRLAEESLIENERKLREAQEMAHLGFWSWDVKSGKVEWSEEVFKIFNLDPEKFIPQIDSIMSLSPWDDENQRDKELINRAMETHTG